MKTLKAVACLALSAYAAVFCCGCDANGGVEETVPETTVQQTTAAPTAAPKPATTDSVAKAVKYNYVAIKQKTDLITSDFDKLVSSEKFMGSGYIKLGNDFEYISVSGYADSDTHTSNSINTVYNLGAVTMQFTAAAVMQLSEQGKLSLDDTLDKYFPKYEAGAELTIESLLTMTSGIPNYMANTYSDDTPLYAVNEIQSKLTDKNSKKENSKIILNWIRDQELSPSKGSFEFSYSNYYLLGQIIEKASGVSYEEYVKENIFEPLGMRSSGFEPNKNTAKVYKDSSGIMLSDGVGYSAAGIYSSVSDLLKWIDGISGGKILSLESRELMFKENGGFGCGVYISGTSVYSEGRLGGYRSVLSYNTDRSEIEIILTNHSDSRPVRLLKSFKENLSVFRA